MKKSKIIFPRIMFSVVLIACCSLLSFMSVSATTYVSHTASQITPGNFSEGMYSFPGTSKVGIGTISPGYALDVVGVMKANAFDVGRGSVYFESNSYDNYDGAEH